MSRPSPVLLPVLLILAALVVAAWWWPNRPQAGDVTMPDTVFNAVSFAPFQRGQSPFNETFPTEAQVAGDVALLAGKVRAIRSYAALGGKADLAALARLHGLKLWQGIWLGNDRKKNAQEMAAAIALANRYPDTIDRVIVGNEVLLRRDLPVEELIADIDTVRRAVKQPVTYADVWDFWRQFPQVAPHVDIVTIHLLPYWEDEPTGIDGAVREVGNAYRQIAAMFPGKPIAIGETGWPSRGRWRRDAAPSRVNQAVFMRRFIALSRQEGFEYCLIESFDQDWKYRSEGTVGANWGLWTDDRRPKFPLSGPVVEDPGWRGEAAISLALGLVLLGGVLWLHRRIRRSWLGGCLALAVLAMALGWALVWAWVGTVPIVYDLQLGVAAAVNLTGQAALALLLLDRAALVLDRASAAGAAHRSAGHGDGAGVVPPAPSALAVAGLAVRRPHVRLRLDRRGDAASAVVRPALSRFPAACVHRAAARNAHAYPAWRSAAGQRAGGTLGRRHARRGGGGERDQRGPAEPAVAGLERGSTDAGRAITAQRTPPGARPRPRLIQAHTPSARPIIPQVAL